MGVALKVWTVSMGIKKQTPAAEKPLEDGPRGAEPHWG
jgi:hypothetical protein